MSRAFSSAAFVLVEYCGFVYRWLCITFRLSAVRQVDFFAKVLADGTIRLLVPFGEVAKAQ